jgi:hypothetical protein
MPVVPQNLIHGHENAGARRDGSFFVIDEFEASAPPQTGVTNLGMSGPVFCTRRSKRVYIAFAPSKVEFSPGRIASGAGGR